MNAIGLFLIVAGGVGVGVLLGTLGSAMLTDELVARWPGMTCQPQEEPAPSAIPQGEEL